MFTNLTIVEANKDVFLGRGITYAFLSVALIVSVRIFYLMYKGSNDWKTYFLALDKTEGIHNFVSHQKFISVVGITAICCVICFDTGYTILFIVALGDDQVGKLRLSISRLSQVTYLTCDFRARCPLLFGHCSSCFTISLCYTFTILLRENLSRDIS